MADRSGPTAPCPICRHLPDATYAETLHTAERLPEQAEQLLVIGGYALPDAEEVRKCPACATYFAYVSDHDSEAGVGPGYTEVSLARLLPGAALALVERSIARSEQELASWRGRTDARHGPRFVRLHSDWLARFRREREALIAALGRPD